MKISKAKKRAIFGFLGVVLALVIFMGEAMTNVTDVTAKTKVFDEIEARFSTSKPIKILEITSSSEVYNHQFYYDGKPVVSYEGHNLKAELGYFMPFSNADNRAAYDDNNYVSLPEDISQASKGTALGVSSMKTKEEILLAHRQYGLLMPIGMDSGWHTKIGEHPIYAHLGVFSIMKKSAEGDWKELSAHFEKGVYRYSTDWIGGANGPGHRYYMDPAKYVLNERGEICTGTRTVSKNDAGAEEYIVSVNSVVTDINQTIVGLPQSSAGEPYITLAEDGGEWNLFFEKSLISTTDQEYWGYGDDPIFYNDAAAYKNSDWFSEYVLGDNEKYKRTDAVYTVKGADKVSDEEIKDYDLIYISGTSAEYAAAGIDISSKVMLELYNQEINNHKAIMMDYALYSAESESNISKLAALLWQESQSDLLTKHKDIFEASTDGQDTVNKIKDEKNLTKAIMDELKASILNVGNGNFVTGNVYVYNHHMADFESPKSMVDALDMFANGDFNTPYKADIVAAGFNSVLNYIHATNKNSLGNIMPTHVTPAVAIQYILVSEGEGLVVMKNTLDVLEIQPVSSFLYNDTRGMDSYDYVSAEIKKNREGFINKYLSDYYSGKEKYINFTSMTIDEFNGRNEDLIETYDVIYIGSEMGSLYYTESLKTRRKENGEYTDNEDSVLLPSYVDNNMDGMVYYNIGDKVIEDENNVRGWLKDNTEQFRYTGRDLTKDKLGKLEAYLMAQKPILVAGDLVAQRNRSSVINPTAILNKGKPKEGYDVGRIDNASNMYELMQYALGYQYNEATGEYENTKSGTDVAYPKYPNLISTGDVDAGLVEKTVINAYVATEKLQLMMVAAPEEYTYGVQPGTQIIDNNSVVYLKEDTDGKRRLKYEFSIVSDEATASYRPHLYIDVNNDGKFSTTSEDIQDIKIVVKANGKEAQRDEDNNYVLYSGVVYQMTRELDKTYSGYLKWKLSVQSNLHTNAHASEEGSTLVKNTDKVKTIHILQINRDNADTLNLETVSTTETSKYAKYLQAVPGYEVVIETVTINTFRTNFTTSYNNYKNDASITNKKTLKEFALDYFDNYELKPPTAANPDGVSGVDMLVLGFGDNFPDMGWENENEPVKYLDAIKAIKYFMEDERPVLLTHDFIMYQSGANQARLLRDTVGMDRYGVTYSVSKETLTDGSVVTRLENRYMASNENDILYSGGAAYDRETDADKKAIELIESTGKAVAYAPGLGRQSVLKNNQGISNATLLRYINKTERNPLGVRRKWLNSENVTSYYGAAEYDVQKLNDGQITSYPYDLPESFGVSKTHAQYFQLDFDADDDNDGESDVVVWYTLGEVTGGLENTERPDWVTDAQWNERMWQENCGVDYDPFSEKNAGPVPSDGYYIYNKGNITYTGAGHGSMTDAPDEEVQLFINTLFAAYNAGKTKPSAGFYETAPDADDEPISNLIVPYDENVTGENPTDSSVLKKPDGTYRYQFVNPNASAFGLANGADVSRATPIYYRLNDTNFVRGEKYIQVEYYLEAKGSRAKKDATGKVVEYQTDIKGYLPTTTITVDGVSVPVVDISEQIATFKVNSNGQFESIITPSTTGGRLLDMQSGSVYGFYLPMTYLDDDSSFTIYIKTKTRVYTTSSLTGEKLVELVPGEGYSPLTVTKTDLLDLD